MRSTRGVDLINYFGINLVTLFVSQSIQYMFHSYEKIQFIKELVNLCLKSFIRMTPGLVFAKQLTNYLRSLSWQGCLIPKVITTFKVRLLQLTLPYIKNDRKIIVKSFVNTTPNIFLRLKRFNPPGKAGCRWPGPARPTSCRG